MHLILLSPVWAMKYPAVRFLHEFFLQDPKDISDKDLADRIETVKAENQALELHNAHLLNLLTEYVHLPNSVPDTWLGDRGRSQRRHAICAFFLSMH